MAVVISAVVIGLVAAVAAVLVRRATAERDLAAGARDAATAERDTALADAVAASARADHADEARAAADEREARTRKHASEVAGRVGDLTTDLDRVRADLAARELVIADLRAEVAAAHSTATTARAEILWSLELARVERTWRSSVAPDPTMPSGVVDAADPVDAALQVEAAAAREEIGTNVACRVTGFTSRDPERDIVAVRAAQEAIAHAARDVDELVIEVTADGTAVRLVVEGDGSAREVPALADWRADEGYRL